jgi:hypothetical protein
MADEERKKPTKRASAQLSLGEVRSFPAAAYTGIKSTKPETRSKAKHLGNYATITAIIGTN